MVTSGACFVSIEMRPAHVHFAWLRLWHNTLNKLGFNRTLLSLGKRIVQVAAEPSQCQSRLGLYNEAIIERFLERKTATAKAFPPTHARSSCYGDPRHSFN